MALASPLGPHSREQSPRARLRPIVCRTSDSRAPCGRPTPGTPHLAPARDPACCLFPGPNGAHPAPHGEHEGDIQQIQTLICPRPHTRLLELHPPQKLGPSSPGPLPQHAKVTTAGPKAQRGLPGLPARYQQLFLSGFIIHPLLLGERFLGWAWQQPLLLRAPASNRDPEPPGRTRLGHSGPLTPSCCTPHRGLSWGGHPVHQQTWSLCSLGLRGCPQPGDVDSGGVGRSWGPAGFPGSHITLLGRGTAPSPIAQHPV